MRIPGLLLALIVVGSGNAYCHPVPDMTDSQPIVLIPDTIRANSDGNIVFIQRDDIKTIKLTVYNRWSETVFETTTAEKKAWDNRVNGVPQPDDVYIYVADVVLNDGMGEHIVKDVFVGR